jgi:DNA excision repair protein ERCC-2
MSGTLKPLGMYADVLGVPNAIRKEYRSPFPKKNKLTLVIPDTTTKYSSRSDRQYARIAAHCLRLVNNTAVNSALFFPSYAVLKSVLPYIEESCERTLFVEDRSFSKKEKTSFIERFKSYSDKGGAVLLGVVGGSFSEGYDFAGDVLRLIVVVGVPLGRPDVYTNELIKHYEARFGQGWNYGYVAPALTRVLQAAGRAIRSSTDSGVVVLLDERYAWGAYAQFVPDDAVKIRDALPLVQRFFGLMQ